MKKVTLSSGAVTSRLGFGTSRLHHMHSSSDRQKLLAAALDLGFAHIDVAPSYGDGLAEREVSLLRKARGAAFTLVTKFGIPPNMLVDAAPAFAIPVMAVRAVLRRTGVVRDARRPLDATFLRRSVEASLLRLQTDRIDILLIHEPTLERLVAPDALAHELGMLRDAGKIGGWGLAGGWDAMTEIAARHPTLGPVLQTGQSEWRDDGPRKPDIVYSAMSAGPQTFGARRPHGGKAMQGLEIAIRRRPAGVVLVSASQVAHLKTIADLEATI
jgi:D-threo-aldose 1-dehydrogenase